MAKETAEQLQGDDSGAGKITLRRRQTSTLKATGSGRGRTVNVEVRKKRSFVRPGEAAPAPVARLDDVEQKRQAEAAKRQAEQEARAAQAKAPAAKAAPARAEQARAPQAEAPQAKAQAKPAQAKADAKAKTADKPAAKAEPGPADRVAEPGAAQEAKVSAETKPSARKDKRDRHDLDTDDPQQQKKSKQSGRKHRAEEIEDFREDEAVAEAIAEAEAEAEDEAAEATEGEAPEVEAETAKATTAAKAKAEEPQAKGKAGAKKPAPLGLSSPRLKRGKAPGRRHAFKAPTEEIKRQVEIADTITVQQLSQRMSVKASEVIKTLTGLGIAKAINEPVEQDAAALVVEEFGHTVKLIDTGKVEKSLEEETAYTAPPEPRAPVVTVMGHVDHGKTSLLDHIRQTQVVKGEAGGITQHIGAYRVQTPQGELCFIDTPGHAAFTAMRKRGATATDIVILVVAADDGVMPQTEEAIAHAKGAEVPLVVAVNKMDKEGADPEKVRTELAAKDVVSEAWGGDTQFVEISAATGQGMDELLEAVLLQAELLELTAAKEGPARGLVLESRLDRHRGPMTTLLVQEGRLRQGDVVVAGREFGKVRALADENGQPLRLAGPATPVAVLGLGGTPDAGDPFVVAKDERRAREVASFRAAKAQETRRSANGRAPLLAFGESGQQLLTLVVKADVRGSLEAIVSALGELGNDEVAVNVALEGVGGVNESDANYAVTAGASLFGFNVRADKAAKRVIDAEGLDLRYYKVIYDLVDDVKAALSGMLAPEVREDILGLAEVRDVFSSKKLGQIAGCMVTEGTVIRSKKIRVLRENVVIFEGELESLRHFKDEVEKVASGTECGIGVRHYNDVKVGDQIEVFDTREVARAL